MTERWVFIGASFVTVLLTGALLVAQDTSAGLTEEQKKAFLSAVDRYLEVRGRAERTVPALKETDTPQQISQRETLLAKAIAAEREAAVEGDVFGPAAAPIVAIVRDDWRSRSPKERSDLMSELSAAQVPVINQVYPTAQPLVTTPPSLLRRLPELPETVEYRLFGRHLLLRDVKANLVVDVLRHAVTAAPAPRRKS